MNDSTFQSAFAHIDFELSDDQIAQLKAYHAALLEWNERVNLTRHTDPETFVHRDVLDSIRLAEFLSPGEHVLDLGTGGGVPGVILAIIRPDLQVSLCESVGKKAQAVADIVDQLGLPITVYAGRAEHLLADKAFDTIVARAVGPLWKILKWLKPCWGQFQQLLLVKGPKWVEERGEARHRGFLKQLALRRLASYSTPGHDGESVILAVRDDPARNDSPQHNSARDASRNEAPNDTYARPE